MSQELANVAQSTATRSSGADQENTHGVHVMAGAIQTAACNESAGKQQQAGPKPHEATFAQKEDS